MKSERIYAAIEEASGLIARLDARISVTPWAEAWHIRATYQAAERLAAIDGTPTRSGDILGLMMSSALPSPEAYLPATIGFGHRSEEHTSELQSLMRISYAVFCLKKKTQHKTNNI